jgi:hypothetical protein
MPQGRYSLRGLTAARLVAACPLCAPLAGLQNVLLEEEADGSRISRTIVNGFTAAVPDITQTEGPDLPRSPIRPGTGRVPPCPDRLAGQGGDLWVGLP